MGGNECGRSASRTSRSLSTCGRLAISPRAATAALSDAALGLGWQGAGGCSAVVIDGAPAARMAPTYAARAALGPVDIRCLSFMDECPPVDDDRVARLRRRNDAVHRAGARRLLERVARGDREAFHAFYDRYGARVMAVLRRKVTATGVAAELVQDVFVAVWLGAAHYREESGEPERWLLGIVHHKLQDYWRRQTRALLDQAPPSRRPEATRSDADDRLAVEEAVGRLSSDQRRMLELIYCEGLTFAETARALCVPVGTVKSRVHA